MAVSQGEVLKNVDKLRRDVERKVKELKSAGRDCGDQLS